MTAGCTAGSTLSARAKNPKKGKQLMARVKGFSFTKAFGLLMLGAMVYRRSWMRGTACKFIRLRPGVLIPAIDMTDHDGITGYWKPLQEDLFATDWGTVDG